MAREFDLVVECCRRAFAGDGGGRLEVLAGHADWPLVLRLARRHRVEALVWDALRAIDALPGREADALRADAAAIAEHNLRAAQESALLKEAFSRAEIPLLFVKGLTLAALAYPQPYLKMGWDIDLLVPPGSIRDAAEVLQSNGYAAIEPRSGAPEKIARWHRTRKESTWRNAERGMVVDLHHRLADNPRLIPAIGMESPRQLVEIADGIALPTLPDEELFAYLCVHGASSAWFRLKWITDLAAFVNHRGGGIEQWYRSSQRLGAGRSADQALLLADRLFGLLAGSPLAAELGRRQASRWLADAAYGQLAGPRALAEPTERPLGTGMIHLTQFLLLPGAAFKASELWRQARCLLP